MVGVIERLDKRASDAPATRVSEMWLRSSSHQASNLRPQASSLRSQTPGYLEFLVFVFLAYYLAPKTHMGHPKDLRNLVLTDLKYISGVVLRGQVAVVTQHVIVLLPISAR